MSFGYNSETLSIPVAARQYHMASRPGFGVFFFLNTLLILKHTINLIFKFGEVRIFSELYSEKNLRNPV